MPLHIVHHFNPLVCKFHLWMQVLNDSDFLTFLCILANSVKVSTIWTACVMSITYHLFPCKMNKKLILNRYGNLYTFSQVWYHGNLIFYSQLQQWLMHKKPNKTGCAYRLCMYSYMNECVCICVREWACEWPCLCIWERECDHAWTGEYKKMVGASKIRLRI